ncbi:hypothetical protein JAAARDRAFT_94499, partial [Jaapia argillacea MUCL 33604]
YNDFVKALLFPDYTRPDGVFNIASHFPLDGVIPDLGKCTLSHFCLPEKHAGSALWHIFCCEDSPNIRKFLRDNKHYWGSGDPIHSQNVYLTPELLDQLWQTYGVRPFTIFQHQGHAIFIPVGSAHQVSNVTGCVKVACDFVSPENLDASWHLIEEFRQENQKGINQWKEDILQLCAMSWYAWRSI